MSLLADKLSKIAVRKLGESFARRTAWNLAENPLAARSRALRKKGARLFDLTESNPTRCAFPYPLRGVLEPLGESDNLIYDPSPSGCLAARQAVAAYYRDKGVRISPDSIVLTASTSEAYAFLFRLIANFGDEILVPSPSYPLFEYLATLSDLTLKPYRLEYTGTRWALDAQALERAVGERTRAIISVNPNNPTGSYLRPEDRRAINRAARRHNLALIVDEVFLDFDLAASKERRTLAGNGEALTFVLSGASKVLALPQMKLAWIAASGPARLTGEALKRLAVITDTFLSVSTPIQHALESWLKLQPVMQPAILARVRSNRERLVESLRRIPACRVLATEGGWVAVVEVPRVLTDENWALTLLEKDKVLVHPGYFYDFGSEGYLVLSLLVEAKTFREGVSRLVQRIEKELGIQ